MVSDRKKTGVISRDLVVGVATHCTELEGAADALVDYLLPRTASLIFVKHPFAYTHDPTSLLRRFDKGTQVETRAWPAPRVLSIVRDVAANIWWFSLSSRTHIFFGFDPVNAFCGILLRFLGVTRRVVYYSIDYTPRRFSNRLLNWLYHFIDRFVSRNADEIWNVSPRIADIRRQQGVPDVRNCVVPIGVRLTSANTAINERRRNHVVIVSHLSEDKGVQLAISAMAVVRKFVSEVRLSIIGTGPYEPALRELVQRQGLNDLIKFEGLKSQAELYSYLPQFGIALATYTDNPYSIARYADPTKPKEYLACGLPVVITNVPWIAEAIQSEPMGICVAYDAERIAAAILRLLQDHAFYDLCHKNALRFVRGMDWESIFCAAFKSSVAAAAG